MKKVYLKRGNRNREERQMENAVSDFLERKLIVDPGYKFCGLKNLKELKAFYNVNCGSLDGYVVRELNIIIQSNKIIGEFIGTLSGICLWDIPDTLRSKLQLKIKDLKKITIGQSD